MNTSEIKTLRETIGASVMAAQDTAKEAGTPVEDVLTEVLAALLSLAAYVSYHNMGLSRDTFLSACEVAADQ